LNHLQSKMNPYRLYLFGMELSSSVFVALAFTTATLYYVTSAQLNPLQLVALGTSLELSYFVLQLPTGVAADLVSRRLSVVLGWLLVGIGFAAQGFTTNFPMLLAAQAILGAGAALQSGAQEAWIADELDETAMTPVYLRAAQLGTVGTLIGAALSGVLASVERNVPLIVGGLGILAVGCFLGVAMPERHFHRSEQALDAGGVGKRAWAMFTEQLSDARTAILAVGGFALLLGMSFFVGVWSESFDRLWGAYFIADVGFPSLLGLSDAGWFSVIAIVVALVSLVVTEVTKRRSDRLGPNSLVGTLLVVTVLSGVGVVVMTSARPFAVAVVAYLVVQGLRPVTYPLLTGWIVSRVEPGVRATALSARDLFDSGGQILGGPGVGYVGVIGSLRLALYVGAAALAPAAALLVAASSKVHTLPKSRSGDLGGHGPDETTAEAKLLPGPL